MLRVALGITCGAQHHGRDHVRRRAAAQKPRTAKGGGGQNVCARASDTGALPFRR